MRWMGFILIAAIFLSATMSDARIENGDIQWPPPKPVYEVNPGDRPGYVLAPGFWYWNGTHHVWMPSRWIKQRDGYSWVPDQWEQRGDKWRFAAGYWKRTETNEAAAPDYETTERKINRAFEDQSRMDYGDTSMWPSPRRH